jgi:aerobic carbon-monoxide dehydrogenase small subunit
VRRVRGPDERRAGQLLHGAGARSRRRGYRDHRRSVARRQLDPLQEAFIATGATQCGFCTPGILVNARALLDRNPDPTDTEIREALVGNLCRCTGYIRIIDAVKMAAQARREVLR